tara:strand:+ start:460 stop:723 length:264 start_codon:yes stop_codon:yes gene_type:complete
MTCRITTALKNLEYNLESAAMWLDDAGISMHRGNYFEHSLKGVAINLFAMGFVMSSLVPRIPAKGLEYLNVFLNHRASDKEGRKRLR